MKTQIIIKKAGKKDLLNLVNLWNKGLFKYHQKIANKNDKSYDQPKKNNWTIWKKFAEKNLRSRKVLFLIVYDDKKPIAYCLSVIKKGIPVYKIKEYGLISDLYVEKNYRGKGLGKKLINKSKKFFKKNKLKFMELGVRHNNKSATKVYQKYGFKEYSKLMRMRI